MAATFRFKLRRSGAAAYSEMVNDTANLVSHWRLDESSGTVAADQQGANPGTYTGGCTLGAAGALTPGDPDAAVSLNGTTGYLAFADTASLKITAAITVETWIFATANTGNIIARWAASQGYLLQINGGQPAFFCNGTSIAGAAVTLNAWHHLVGTWDGANMRLYVDGLLAAGPTAFAGPITNGAATLQIGQSGGGFFTGTIDEPAIYSRALSAAEVAAHFAAQVNPVALVDLSSYLRVNPDDRMDPLGAPWVEPAFSETPFSDGQVLISQTVNNREQQWPLFLVDASRGKDQLHALTQQINNAAAVRPLVLEWRDSGASSSTFFDVTFVRFEPDFNFRRSVHGYGAGILHVWTSGYGHTGTTRVTATAAGTGIFLSVPIASVAGDAPALLDTTIVSGAVLPSLGRIIALAPITQPSYTPRIPAASLIDLQANATLIGASGWDGSQYLGLPVSPTGGASGVACRVPLPNPTIAGGDNRILALVKSGIDSGVGIYALDPFGNSMGATAVASMSNMPGLVDLGVCRLPTVGFPTLPKIEIHAGAIWASGAVGPAILASPAGLALGEVFCLPDKNLALILETAVRGSVISKDGFKRTAQLNGQNDDVGNPWSAAWNNISVASPNQLTENVFLGLGANVPIAASSIDSSHLGGLLAPDLVISAKAAFSQFPGSSGADARLIKDIASGAYIQGRLSLKSGANALDLAVATNGTLNTLASLALATLTGGLKYRLSLQCQGPLAVVNLSRDDGGPFFIPGSAAFASVGVASSAAVGRAGVPGLTLAQGGDNNTAANLYSWEVDTIPTSNLQAFDSYRIDGPNADSYRTSSAGVFAGQKLVSVQRGAFPKLAPSTTSLAVLVAPFDQGVANDLISAAVSVRERYTYSR